jgi:hypothetical protein
MRLFALLLARGRPAAGELVEGRLTASLWHGGPGERIEERRRAGFSPMAFGRWGRD